MKPEQLAQLLTEKEWLVLNVVRTSDAQSLWQIANAVNELLLEITGKEHDILGIQLFKPVKNLQRFGLIEHCGVQGTAIPLPYQEGVTAGQRDVFRRLPLGGTVMLNRKEEKPPLLQRIRNKVIRYWILTTRPLPEEPNIST